MFGKHGSGEGWVLRIPLRPHNATCYDFAIPSNLLFYLKRGVAKIESVVARLAGYGIPTAFDVIKVDG